jgi:hypothetical protein
MRRLTWIAFPLFGALLLAPRPALPCSLCGGSLQSQTTLRQELEQAKLVVYGTLANPRFQPGGSGTGTTELHVIKFVKTPDPAFAKNKVIEIPRYVPVVDPKDPPKYVVFCDVVNGKLEVLRGRQVKSTAVVDYLEQMTKDLKGKDRTQALAEFFFRYLGAADESLAADAFLEFAKSTDQEIGKVAVKVSAEKIRPLLQNTKTPAERLSLYAFLLGACGGKDDAKLLRELINQSTERTRAALDGLLGGYIQLQRQQGWDLALSILGDSRKGFTERFAVIRTLRFFHSWQPETYHKELLQGLKVTLAQGDIADMAIEDLRRWHMWDLTPDVLALYGKKSHDAPILRRAIIRYALCCPKTDTAAQKFVAEVARQDQELIQDLREGLEFEKQPES